MADPTTEIAKEFLEFNNYLVRLETKFWKNKDLKGTAGDLDIIAVRPEALELNEIKLKEEIVAEVKNWMITTKKEMDYIYKDKFKYINDLDQISWKQLKNYISDKNFDRVLFCLGTTNDIYNYAYNEYNVKIITTGFIIKKFCDIFKKRDKGKMTYYPEAYHYHLIRTIMIYFLNSYRYEDKLLLEDFIWIDPKKEHKYRNEFNKLNTEFMTNFIYNDEETLIKFFGKLLDKDKEWRIDQIINIIKKDKSLLEKTRKKIDNIKN